MLKSTSLFKTVASKPQTRSYAKTYVYRPTSAEETYKSTEAGLSSQIRERLNNINLNLILKNKGAKTAEIDEKAPVYDAVKMMADRNMGSLLVSRKGPNGKELAGIFTERDYIRKIILKDLRSKTTPMSQVMTPNIVTASPDTPLIDAASSMILGKFRHLPVIPSKDDNTDKLSIGIISSRDIVTYLLQTLKESDISCLKSTVADVFNQLCRKSSEQPYVSSDDTVFNALKLMEKQNIGAVFVHQANDLVGIFTERDYLKRVLVKGKFSKDASVESVMTKEVLTAPPTETVKNALELMTKNGFRNLPVVPLLGQTIDYADGYEVEGKAVIGMITEMNIINFMFMKCLA